MEENQQSAAPPQSPQERYEELRKATLNLLTKLRDVHESEAYKQVWQLYAVHGLRYQGPSYNAEMIGVVDVLTRHGEARDAGQ